MKLLVDLFACQTRSRYRGIGRYVTALMQEMIRQRKGHNLLIMANALYNESFEELRQEYTRLLGTGAFKPYFHPAKNELDIDLDGFTAIAESLVCQAYQAAAPDITLVPSVFESQTWIEEGVVPLIQKDFPSSKKAAILYDFIPYVFPEQYLGNEMVYQWYLERVKSLKNFDLLLAISESTRQDAIRLAGIQPEKVVNISGAVTANFQKVEYRPDEKNKILAQFGIAKPFILCGANHDYRKNLDGMIHAYGLLPPQLRSRFQLVLNQVGDKEAFLNKVRSAGISEAEVVVTGYITDADLINLYNLCHVFVFPSLYEGFGLPVLEAMACGAAVIASNNSSIPEILDRADALFDANDDQSIADNLTRTLSDDRFREELRAYSQERARFFSWENTARTAWLALENLYQEKPDNVLVETPPGPTKPAVAYVLIEKDLHEGSITLLRSLSRYFTIDLFSTWKEQVIQVLGKDFRVYSFTALKTRVKNYATVVYACKFGHVSEPVISMMKNFPGVVDFVDWQLPEKAVNNLRKLGSTSTSVEDMELLWASHGLKAVVDALLADEAARQHEWPSNWLVLKHARKLILHHPNQIKDLETWYGNSWYPVPTLIPNIDSSSSSEDVLGSTFAYSSVIVQTAAEADRNLFDRLIYAVSERKLSEVKVKKLSYIAASNWRLRDRPGLLIDVTRICKLDLKSGIQRVVKNIVRELYKTDDFTLRIELVHMLGGKMYRANRFAESQFQLPYGRLGEEPQVEVHPGDILFLLDLELEDIESYQPAFDQVRRGGGKIITTIYDLIPLRFPYFYNPPTCAAFERWLRCVVRNSDLLLCISKATAEDVYAYIIENSLEAPQQQDIDYFHLGGDIEIIPGEGSVRSELLQLKETSGTPLFLMVGTLEPRKGYVFVLDAFERLWQQGIECRLCIAGRQGWDMELFEARIRNHPEFGKRLFFIEKPSDAEIDLCYSMATALVAASLSEGFGLPIWEAAAHGVPSVVSDIPVFHEIGGSGVVYFSLNSPNSLAEAIINYLKQPSEERQNLLKQIQILSWQESALWVLDAIYGRRKPYLTRQMNGERKQLETRQGKIYVDITSSLKYRAYRPNGIVRTELECINFILRTNPGNVQFCAFSYDDHRLMTLNAAQVIALFSGNHEVGSRAAITSSTTQPAPSSESPVRISVLPPTTFRARIKRVIRKTGGRIYRGLPAEVREHFRLSALEGVEMLRSGWSYLRNRGTQPAAPPVQPIETRLVEEIVPLSMTPFGPSDVYVCLGFMWDYLDMGQLYQEKTAKGFKLITLVYDLIPILMPEYANGNMPSFSKAIMNQIWASDALFCISDHTMRDLKQFMDTVHAPEREVRRIYLSSYQPPTVPSEQPSSLKNLAPGKYVLCVGTMEPRKNHEILFQVWRALYNEHEENLLPLVIVGSLGWHTQDLRSKIELNPWLHQKHILWYSNVSDEELEWLYRNCRFTVYPSLYEGWGLPITESIDRGKLCISSNAASMVEAGQGLIELLHPLDFFAWKERIALYLTDDQRLRDKERQIIEHRQVTNWEKTFSKFFTDIAEIIDPAQREDSQ